jgi:hypothetical protein
VELGVIATAAAIYLVAFPERPMAVDVALALVGLALVAATARDTRDNVWGTPATPGHERRRHAARLMLGLTTLGLVVLATWGAGLEWQAGGNARAITSRLLSATLVAVLPFYVAWAVAQQTLFQFYLLGRVRALVPSARPLAISIVNGILFGAVHVPDAEVTALTMIGGAVWSHVYQRDRHVLPLALSHAILGAAFFHWIRGRDLILDWLAGR